MHSYTITVFGAGYVGLPLAVLMALGQCVRLLGIGAPKIDLIQHGIGHGLPENPFTLPSMRPPLTGVPMWLALPRPPSTTASTVILTPAA